MQVLGICFRQKTTLGLVVLKFECVQESPGELIGNADSQVPPPKLWILLIEQGAWESASHHLPQVLWMPVQSPPVSADLRAGRKAHPPAASSLCGELNKWIKMTQKFIGDCLLNEQRKMNIHLHFNLDWKNLSLLSRTRPNILVLWKWKIGVR